MNLYDPSQEYVVERRFNDFKQLHEVLTSNPDYKGRAIPSLPPDAKAYSDYLQHTDNFLTERQQALERYLKVILTH